MNEARAEYRQVARTSSSADSMPAEPDSSDLKCTQRVPWCRPIGQHLLVCTQCPYTVHHNSKIAGLTSPRRMPPGDATSPPDGATPDMTFSPDRRPSKRPYPFQLCPTSDTGPKEAEMHQLLEVLRPADTESACSGDGSNPDSGRGPSEQGHQELDKGESDSHSDGQQRSSVSSTESAPPFPPPLALNNPPLPRAGSCQLSSAGQYPVQVSRGQDIRPHVYTELKTFSPGIHVRQPNNPGGGARGGVAGDVGGLKPPVPVAPSAPTGTTCQASLPRFRSGNGSHTTTTFGTAPNGSQTITTFGKPRPLCSDGMELAHNNGGLQDTTQNADPCSDTDSCKNGQTTPECRPLSMRAANVRIPEPPRPPGVQETNLDDAELIPIRTPTQQTAQQPNDIKGGVNGKDVLSDVMREVATDGDTSQDSGVVDAQELCQTIDDAFFKGMVIKQKTLV